VTDPVPTAVPVKVTEQLPADKVQVLALSEPPVNVNVNVTIPPVGVLAGVVVSVTVATTGAVQLTAPNAMLQLTFATLVDVLSFATVIVLDAVGPLPL
jgi:hypothetical protein